MVERRQALVIGGSLAGQLSAAALARAGFDVTILDRDELPDEAEPRKGLPQGRHIHVLLVGGQRAMERLLPGITGRLTAAGAHLLDFARDVAVHSLAGWHGRHESELESVFMSRDLLDREVRRAVAALPGVRTLSGHEVTGLSGDNNVVFGVRCRRRGADAEDSVFDADLVVDASGRDSKAPNWLAALGLGAAAEQVVEPFLGYSTRLCRMPENFSAPWKAMIVRSHTEITRGGGIVPIEGGRWLVTLAGFSKDYPPLEEAEFMEFARSLGVPEFAQAVAAAEPLSQAVGFRRTTNRWRRYDEMRHWPEGFVAIGDAVCAFNPYYGQGMSVAALSALALGEAMTTGPQEERCARFQRRLAEIIARPWLMATTEECRYPGTQGAARGFKTRLNLWFTDRLLTRAAHDPKVRNAFLSVAQLVEPSSILMRPAVLLPVLFAPRGKRAGPEAGGYEAAGSAR
jgi:2-polyprenyl-6-methoxyphenol hydroxylase-like FAD-dependent oxidoreductase